MVGEIAGGGRVSDSSSLTDEFEETGRLWFRGALTGSDLNRFDEICAVDGKPGLRLDATIDLKVSTGENSTVAGLVGHVLPDARPVRFVAFNKSDGANWLVPWHQDRVIAVGEKHDVSGFSNWSQKSGTWHCEPPIDLLTSMLFARIHLDDTAADNGCLEIAQGTHKLGFIAAARADAIANQSTIETCKTRRGDLLLIKALTLHRSKPSRMNTSRRTLRVDYSNANLPAPLTWWVAMENK